MNSNVHMATIALMICLDGCDKKEEKREGGKDDIRTEDVSALRYTPDRPAPSIEMMGTDLLIFHGSPPSVKITRQCGNDSVKTSAKKWIDEHRGLSWNSDRQVGTIYSVLIDVVDVPDGFLLAEFDKDDNRIQVRFNSTEWGASSAEIQANRLLLQKYQLDELREHAERAAIQCSRR